MTASFKEGLILAIVTVLLTALADILLKYKILHGLKVVFKWIHSAFCFLKDRLSSKKLIIEKLKAEIRRLVEENGKLTKKNITLMQDNFRMKDENDKLVKIISKNPSKKTYAYDLRNYEGIDWKINFSYNISDNYSPIDITTEIENPSCPKCQTPLTYGYDGFNHLVFICLRKCGFSHRIQNSMYYSDLQANVIKVAISDFKKDFIKLTEPPF